jgi:outer membrane receptor for ferrienterochelin and colicins
MKYISLIIVSFIFSTNLFAQNSVISGKVSDANDVVPYANVYLKGTSLGAITDKNGKYIIIDIPTGEYELVASFISYIKSIKTITATASSKQNIDIELKPDLSSLNEIVVSGTMKPMSRLESPVPVDVYSAEFFKSNPTPSIYEALQNVNGVRPQINCAVCNTGDIHINGLEGAYTMVTIDGMPIVSGLSTVYGLSGIPQSLIERVEIVKGPASTLYGSESVGG